METDGSSAAVTVKAPGFKLPSVIKIYSEAEASGCCGVIVCRNVMERKHGLNVEEETSTKEELAKWEITNKLLKRHGCTAVRVSKPQDWKNVSGGVVLDSQSSHEVRSAIKSLVEDTERRQNMIHDLIKANNQLKEDVQLQQNRAARHEQKAKDLQKILDSVKTKIHDLEDNFISKTCKQQTQMKNLMKDKQMVQDQCQKHKEEIGDQEHQISLLKKRLSQAERAEEERKARQRKVFLHLVKRPLRENNVMDQQILDIIDGYERQVNQLQKALREYEVDDIPVRERKYSDQSLDLDASPNYKALLKSYQEQIKSARDKQELLMRENSQTQEELASRPTMKEFKHCKQQMRRLEKILLQNNISFRGKTRDQNKESVEQPLATSVQNLDQLPASECRQYLQDVCFHLNVLDLKDLITTATSNVKRAEKCSRLYKILTDIRSILGSQRAPKLVYKHSTRLQETDGPDYNEESDFLHLLPTIEMWAGQLLSLKALYRALNKLCERLLPHQQEMRETNESVRVEDLLLLVDTMIEDVGNSLQDGSRVSPHILQALVSHFQKLFDVPSLSGVYPRLNEVYSRMGEINNMMKNLRCVLGMDDKASCSALVHAVWEVCKELEEGESHKLNQIFGTLDIDSVINKIQEHEEFFPAFEGLIRKLLDVLEICRLEEILPEVRKLKKLASH
ncbi:centrosomal protein of 70 kDa [Pelodytes ibericus]